MIVYLICYLASFLTAMMGHYYFSGIFLIGAAVYLYVREFRSTGNCIHLRGIFSLAWVGGQGISCLKLSRLARDWSLMTWLCFLAAFLGFYFAYEFFERRGRNNYNSYAARWKGQKRWHDFRSCEEPVFVCAVAIAVVSLLCFAAEAVILGYVPFFLRGVPHAYSYFHITGVHYFTVSCVLVPALTVIFFHSNGGRDRLKTGILIGMDVIALLIPILCVSRFQLILAVALAVLTYLMMDIHIDPLQMMIGAAGLFVVMVIVYVILTIARSHDVEYLNGIFEMKNSRMPIFITQPYMYIANNYDNFDCLVEALAAGHSHSFGLRMLFPLWALTGLKFLFPQLTAFELFTTKEELTTVTLFYDAYYDFGIFGVVLLACALGALAFYLTDMVKHIRNPIGYLLYAQIAVYFGLSFFTTWFSNPATWFYLVLTGAAAVYVEWRQ